MLFIHQLPEHQGGVCTTGADHTAVVEQETSVVDSSTVSLYFVVFGFGTSTRIPTRNDKKHLR